MGPWLLVLAMGALLFTPSPSSAQFQELFSWWRRELLPLSLEPGAWVELERIEAAEGQVVTDTLTCRVLESETHTYWVEIEASGAETGWILHIDLDQLARPEVDLFAAMLDLWYVGDDGELEQEDLEELGESRMVRRHLQDLFVDPDLERTALADSTVHGTDLSRERVVLTEVQETTTPMGGRTLAHVTNIRSVAVISPAVPVFGLLSAVTDVVVSSEWRSEGKAQSGPPPLMSRVAIRCLDFGRQAAAGLPAPLRGR